MRIVRSLWEGLALICPLCHRGRMFRSRFSMHRACPTCGAVFEREEGARTGGMYINIVVTGVIFGIGFVAMEVLTPLSDTAIFLFWMAFMLLFPIVFYPHTRGLWVGIINLLGMVYPDDEAPGGR